MTDWANKIMALNWTPNPGFPVPPEETIRKSLDVGDAGELARRAERWISLYERREKAIDDAEKHPLECGVELECWEDADNLLDRSSLLCIFGGNRAGKSEYAAKRVVQTLLDYPETFIFCACQKLQTSGLLMQKKIWHYLPRHIKDLNHRTDRQGIFNVRFTEADGFSKNTFVLPNKSKVLFVGYSQETKDYEGLEFGNRHHKVIGAWAEEDMPLGWLKLIRARTSNFGAKTLWTFTAVDGLTKTMQDVLRGVKTVESKPAKELDQGTQLLPDCPKGHAPYIISTFKPKDNAIFFFTEFNPWSNYEEVREMCKGQPTFFWERRLYGFARSARGRQMPTFGHSHIVSDDKIFWDTPGINVMVADPAGHRNWFMLWGRIIKFEVPRLYIYREWPSRKEYGEWHVTSEGNKVDGDKGPAQDPLGYGYVEYKRLIKEKEHEPIYLRLIDPRAGREQRASDFGQTCIIDQMYQIQRDPGGQIIGPSMDFVPALGLEEGTGIVAINDMLRFDQNQPLDWIQNFPNLLISKECGNLIDAMETYTGADGLKAACKDPIDCLRYMVTYGIEYVDPDKPLYSGGYTY